MSTPLPDLLDELLRTSDPGGQEGAVRDVVRRELEPLADEVGVDAAGGLVAQPRGTDRSAPAVHLDALVDVGVEPGLDPQTAVWQSSDSDASQAQASGRTARAALLCLPTLSTHGCEVLHSGTVDRTARLLAAFLARPLPAVT